MNAHVRMLNQNEIIDQFRAAMAAAGIRCSENIKPDTDQIVRFTVEGDRKKSLNGWYILHTDGIPAGEFGSWKTGVQQTWCSQSRDSLTDDQRRQLEARRAEDRARREAAEKERQQAAAQHAETVWGAATECTTHPYLARKGVASFGLRVGRWTRISEDTGEVWLDVPNALLIPIRKGKRLVSLQAVFAEKNAKINRDKDFLPGGEKRGCFFSIGKPVDDRPTIVIGEGYATCASIHMATGFPVLVAFDAGNINSVAESARKNYPLAVLVIAADNDRWTTQPIENPGLHFAKAAAEAHKAWVALPEFKSLDSKPTDFNDLHREQGLEAVRAQIEAAINPDVPDVVPDCVAGVMSAANDNEPSEISVDFISPLPHCNSKGKPLTTIENLMEICRRLRTTVRYNVIRKEVELLIPGQGFSIDNEGNASLAWLMSACSRFGFPTDKIQDFLCYMGDQNPYNPVTNWILSKPWDGMTRLPSLLSTVHADGEEDDENIGRIKEALITRWLLSAVAAAFEPNGVSAHGVLVLQGEQYLGKTAWFKSLVPKSLEVIQDGLILRPDDRDSVKQVVANWMVELGELDATFRKSDIAQLKAFITRDRDVLRRAYARLESYFARRTVFFASVNQRQFLHDPTGNRRYWTISCVGLDHQHGIDMQQLWREVYETLYRRGEKWYLTPDEMALLNSHNADFEVLDPIHERLQSRYSWDENPAFWRWMTATDIMAELGFDKPTVGDVTKCGQIVQKMNGGRSKKSNGKKLSAIPGKIPTY